MMPCEQQFEKDLWLTSSVSEEGVLAQPNRGDSLTNVKKDKHILSCILLLDLVRKRKSNLSREGVWSLVLKYV